MPKDRLLLSDDEYQKIKGRAEQIKQTQDKVKEMYKDLADMYWISETDTGVGNSDGSIRYNREAYGSDDIRLTASTSSRDRVMGVQRMLRTTRPEFTVKCKHKSYADKIEKFLDRVWDASNARKKTSLESDLSLSGTLFADEHINVTAVDDMIEKEDQTAIRSRLEELRKKNAVILKEGSQLVNYSVWGKHAWKNISVKCN